MKLPRASDEIYSDNLTGIHKKGLINLIDGERI